MLALEPGFMVGAGAMWLLFVWHHGVLGTVAGLGRNEPDVAFLNDLENRCDFQTPMLAGRPSFASPYLACFVTLPVLYGQLSVCQQGCKNIFCPYNRPYEQSQGATAQTPGQGARKSA